MLDADRALNEFMEPAGPSRERFLFAIRKYTAHAKGYFSGERQCGCCVR